MLKLKHVNGKTIKYSFDDDYSDLYGDALKKVITLNAEPSFETIKSSACFWLHEFITHRNNIENGTTEKRFILNIFWC